MAIRTPAACLTPGDVLWCGDTPGRRVPLSGQAALRFVDGRTGLDDSQMQEVENQRTAGE
ncbi:hypothetical protein [Methylobacterium currus]|nr:hypothetical protein [Methylobacterium currus]